MSICFLLSLLEERIWENNWTLEAVGEIKYIYGVFEKFFSMKTLSLHENIGNNEKIP